jgi:trk system potassium uptake protein TrkH
MRNQFRRIHYTFHFLGYLLETLGAVFLLPLVVVFIYWKTSGDGWTTVIAFALPSVLSFVAGRRLRKVFRAEPPDTTGSMLICTLGWLIASAFGALPFVIGVRLGYLNAYFEAISGFTTTGFTVLSGLDTLPRSILFWRALTQWVGGIGILSFFLAITFRGTGAHHVFGAESHKIASTRPVPGIFNTLKILWGIYGAFTLIGAVVLALEQVPVFDAVCHALTTLSTGGFSPHDASIAHYALTGHPHHKLIEYTLTLMMMVGAINFLIHYRVLTGNVRAFWDNMEIRYWWRFIAIFTLVVLIDHLYKSGTLGALLADPTSIDAGGLEQSFRRSAFQVTAIMTTTGYVTQDLGSDFFPALSKQLFLVMMVFGGCVGSTSGGFKMMRVVLLTRLMMREIRKLWVPSHAVTDLIVDGKPVPDDEVHRTAAIFFTWMALIAIGGGITALFSNQGTLSSLSGMFSALGNIGPCYIRGGDLIEINPVVKITYIFGMLAGRLEILPVLLLFSGKAWRG